jgi:F-type H+-transporting ATPase subunit gamma
MAKPRAILKRRRAVQGIARITKTMQMIATAKFKRAFDRAVAARPYTDRLTALIAELSATVTGFTHPLLAERTPRRVAILAVAGNRGLCGGYNSGVARALGQARRDLERRGFSQGAGTLEVVVAGKKIASVLKFQRVRVDALHTRFEDKPSFAQVDEVASGLLTRYERGELDEVHLVYTKFLSSARQRPVAERILPLALPSGAPAGAAKGHRPDWIFSPDAATILSELLPRSVRMRVFQAFLDAAVSEQTARMIAMKAATDNAGDMIRSLTMLYNRSRQSQITTELSEIMGGAAALE